MSRFLVSSLVAALATCGSSSDPVIVQTSYGPVRGVSAAGFRVFRGIPYAAPPVGDLRFRPPQRHKGWKDALDASDFGASCLQSASPCWNTLNVSRMSEDCLSINIVTPKKPGSYPVMFYIHAGEFRCGSSNDLESNFPYFADDIVLVTFNFRLGVLGFLAADELRSRHPSGGTGNYGLLDQRFAMQWVQENIAAFGGDPSKVTIWGESSGGTSVSYHLTAFGQAPSRLFRRAILESPGLTQVKAWKDAKLNMEYTLAVLAAVSSPGCGRSSGYLVFPDNKLSSRNPMRTAENLTLAAAKTWCTRNPACTGFWQSGVTTTFVDSLYADDHEAEGKHEFTAFVKQGPTLPEERLKCLLSADASLLVESTLAVPRDDTFETDGWAPVLDGVDLPEPILNRVVKGEVAQGVDLLGGANLDDGTEFMFLAPHLRCNSSQEEFLQWLEEFYGSDIAKNVSSVYKPSDLLRPLPYCQDRVAKVSGEEAVFFNAAMRSAGDKAVTCPTRQLLKQATGRSFFYIFKRTPTFSFNFPDISIMGAFHGAEVPFAFGQVLELRSEADLELSAAMACYWRSFAYHGDPSKETCGHPAWPNFQVAGNMVLSLDTVILATTEDELSKQRCNVFDVRVEARAKDFIEQRTSDATSELVV